MEHKITVVGVGPGSADYVLPIAMRAIERASVIVGGKRALASFAHPKAQTCVVDRDIAGVLRFIDEQLATCGVVVLVSGDPGFYSLLTAINTKFPTERIEVIPGISSVQVAFARAGIPWQDAVLGSLHGRQTDEETLSYRQGKKLGLLTDPLHNPTAIAQLLLDRGWPRDTKVRLYANLSYPDETMAAAEMADVKTLSGFDHCVMVVTA